MSLKSAKLLPLAIFLIALSTIIQLQTQAYDATPSAALSPTVPVLTPTPTAMLTPTSIPTPTKLLPSLTPSPTISLAPSPTPTPTSIKNPTSTVVISPAQASPTNTFYKTNTSLPNPAVSRVPTPTVQPIINQYRQPTVIPTAPSRTVSPVSVVSPTPSPPSSLFQQVAKSLTVFNRSLASLSTAVSQAAQSVMSALTVLVAGSGEVENVQVRLSHPFISAQSTYTINFTPANDVPKDGEVLIRLIHFNDDRFLPFDLTGASFNFETSSREIISMSVSDSAKNILRFKTSGLDKGQSYKIVLHHIKNPNQANEQRFLVLETKDDQGRHIDGFEKLQADIKELMEEFYRKNLPAGTSISNFFSISPLDNMSVDRPVFSNNFAQEKASYQIRFIPQRGMPADGRLMIEFFSSEGTFDLTQAWLDQSAGQTSEDFDAIVERPSVNSVVINLKSPYQGLTAQMPYVIKLDNVINPNIEQSPEEKQIKAFISIAIKDAKGEEFEDPGVSENFDIKPVPFTIKAMPSENNLVGLYDSYLIDFMPGKEVPARGKLLLEFYTPFPFEEGQFDLTKAALDFQKTSSEIWQKSTMEKSISPKNLLAFHFKEKLEPGRQYTIKIDNVKNPQVPGPAGIAIATQDQNRHYLEGNLLQAPPSYLSAFFEIKGARLQSASDVVGAVSRYTIQFTPPVNVPHGGRLKVQFNLLTPPINNFNFEKIVVAVEQTSPELRTAEILEKTTDGLLVFKLNAGLQKGRFYTLTLDQIQNPNQATQAYITILFEDERKQYLPGSFISSSTFPIKVNHLIITGMTILNPTAGELTDYDISFIPAQDIPIFNQLALRFAFTAQGGLTGTFDLTGVIKGGKTSVEINKITKREPNLLVFSLKKELVAGQTYRLVLSKMKNLPLAATGFLELVVQNEKDEAIDRQKTSTFEIVGVPPIITPTVTPMLIPTSIPPVIIPPIVESVGQPATSSGGGGSAGGGGGQGGGGGGNGGGVPSGPAGSRIVPVMIEVFVNKVAAAVKDILTVMVNKNTVRFNGLLSVNDSQIPALSNRIGNYWQLSDIYYVVFKNTTVKNPFYLSFNYAGLTTLTGVSENSLKIAFSASGRNWKILAARVNKKNKTLSLMTKNTGFFMIVGYKSSPRKAPAVKKTPVKKAKK